MTDYLDLYTEKHGPCEIWLQLRMRVIRPKHPKLKFQVTKLALQLRGSQPVYVGYLVAPFVYESGKGEYLRRDMADARAEIRLTKEEMSGARAQQLLIQRRTEAAHQLLDMVERNKIPRSPDGSRYAEATYWGTLQDLFPDNPARFPNQ